MFEHLIKKLDDGELNAPTDIEIAWESLREAINGD